MENKIKCPNCKIFLYYEDNLWKCPECEITIKPYKKCEHKNVTAEFMGGGFLRICNDCNETIY